MATADMREDPLWDAFCKLCGYQDSIGLQGAVRSGTTLEYQCSSMGKKASLVPSRRRIETD